MKQIQLFYSYSHKDESLRDELEKHLSSLKISRLIGDWHDRRIAGGTEWANEIDKQLERSQIILLLVSADFLASPYCSDTEMQRALEKHAAGEARVIPIILRPVDWTGTAFAHLQALPKDGKPVTGWPNQDEGWLDVARGIRLVCQDVQRAKSHLGSVSSKGSGIRIRCMKDHLVYAYTPKCVVESGDLSEPFTLSKEPKIGNTKEVFTLSWKLPTILPLEPGVTYRITAYCDVPMGHGAFVSIGCKVKENQVLQYVYQPCGSEKSGRPTQLIWDD